VRQTTRRRHIKLVGFILFLVMLTGGRASFVLLTLAGLTTIGAVWQQVAGRDPLSGAPRKVRPLPPAIGRAVFVGGIAVLFWFFTAPAGREGRRERQPA